MLERAVSSICLQSSQLPLKTFPSAQLIPTKVCNRASLYLNVKIYHILIFESISGRCPVPDLRFDWLCDLWQSPSKIPAYLHITDIAGLIRGASGSHLQDRFSTYGK